MKTLITKSDNVSRYAFEDATQVTITEQNIVVGGPDAPEFIIGDLNSTNSELVENVTPPDNWKSGRFKLESGSWVRSVFGDTREVSMRQARLALLRQGKLAEVKPALASLPSPAKEEAEIEWEYATTVERNSPLIISLAPALGLSDGDLDALFDLASTL